MKTVLLLCEGAFFFLSFCLICNYLRYAYHKKNADSTRFFIVYNPVDFFFRATEQKKFRATLGAAYFVGFLYCLLSFVIHVEAIGHPFEKKEYQAWYIAEVSPDINHGTIYKAKALIRAENGRYNRFYFIERIVLFNGEIIDISENDKPELNKWINISTGYGRDLTIRLRKKVPPRIEKEEEERAEEAHRNQVIARAEAIREQERKVIAEREEIEKLRQYVSNYKGNKNHDKYKASVRALAEHDRIREENQRMSREYDQRREISNTR